MSSNLDLSNTDVVTVALKFTHPAIHPSIQRRLSVAQNLAARSFRVKQTIKLDSRQNEDELRRRSVNSD